MSEYHKIHSLFMRDESKNYRNFIEGQWARPEFEYLASNQWIFEEKIDGTNIRIILKDGVVSFGGRTDNAQMPTFLYAKLCELFPTDKVIEAFPDRTEAVLYGEGYGAKIQKGGGDYIPDGCGFILFDVTVGARWLSRESVTEVAEKFGIARAPTVGQGTLLDAIEMCRTGFPSLLRATAPEGLVMRPCVDLFARNGSRIISKLKLKDYR